MKKLLNIYAYSALLFVLVTALSSVAFWALQQSEHSADNKAACVTVQPLGQKG